MIPRRAVRAADVVPTMAESQARSESVDRRQWREAAPAAGLVVLVVVAAAVTIVVSVWAAVT